MKSKHNHDQQYFKHHQEITDIGQREVCPISQPGNNSDTAQQSNLITWLRLQNHKLGYRLLYCDVAVCCAYILFIFSALKFNSFVAKYTWLSVIIMLVLMAGCIIFIGVHLLAHKKAGPKPENRLHQNWNGYRQLIDRLPISLKIYSAGIIVMLILFGYNERAFSASLSGSLLLLTALFFGYGLFILIQTLNAKRLTKAYVAEAAGLARNNIK